MFYSVLVRYNFTYNFTNTVTRYCDKIDVLTDIYLHRNTAATLVAQ